MPDCSAANRGPSTQKTIAVIGGGPAGAATAYLLSKALHGALGRSWSERFSIKLFHTPPTAIHQIGESLPPAATPLLRRLGLGDLLSPESGHVRCPGSVSVWNSPEPGHNDFLFDGIGEGYHLNRAVFDEQLREAADQSGVVLLGAHRLVGVTRKENSFLLRFSTNEPDAVRYEADFLIDASGPAAVASRRLGIARNTLDEVIFHCGFFQLPDDSRMISHTLIEAVPDGWWYAARLPDRRCIVTFCTDVHVTKERRLQSLAHWQQALQGTFWIKDHLPESVFTEPNTVLYTRQAASTLLSAVMGQGWLAVGDAASRYDPITSAGITKAIIQAEVAASAAAEALLADSIAGLRTYQDSVFAEFAAYAGLRRTLYASEQRFRAHGFWKRRLGENGG